MRARLSVSRFALPAIVALGLFAASGCAAEPTEERATNDSSAVALPECTPAAEGSPGECKASTESDALLDEFIAQCPFDATAVTHDWTEDYGWVWWNPAQSGTTASVGVELTSGDVICT